MINSQNAPQIKIPPESISIVTSNSINQMSAVGTKRVATILMNFSDTTNNTPNVQDARLNFINRAQPFYDNNSFGKLTVTGDVYGWYTFPPLNINCNFECMTQTAINLADSDINFNNYDQIIISYYSHLNSFANSSTVGAWWSWSTNEGLKSFPVAHIETTIFVNSTDSNYVRALSWTLDHELGHSFGVWHANGWDCGIATLGNNCKSLDYNDFWDIMGDSITEDLLAHFSGYHKELFGWFTPSNIQEITSSGIYEIYPIEKVSNYSQILKIRRGTNEWYYLENRVASGFDSNLPPSATDGLIIRIAPTLIGTGDTHLLDSTPNSKQFSWDFEDAGWTYGTTFQDLDNHLEITPLSKQNGVLSVKIKFTDTITPTPTPIPPNCIPRPSCLDAKPRPCHIPEPADGWCNISTTPRPK